MFFFKKKYKFIFLLVPLIFLYRYDLILYAEPMEDRVGEVFLMHFFGGSYNMDQLNLSVSVLGLFGIIFLDLLFTDYISQDVLINAEYIFSRYGDRSKWYRRKIGGVICYSIFGILLYMAMYVLNAIYTSKYDITRNDIIIIACTFLMLALFTSFSILLINLLGISLGNTAGFLVCYSVFILSTVITRHLQGDSGNKAVQFIHRFNPMSNLLVSWNFSQSFVLWGLGYYVTVNMLVIILLWRKIRSLEIGMNMRTDVS